MVKQYFIRAAQRAQAASEFEGFCQGAREEYARIAQSFRNKAAACL